MRRCLLLIALTLCALPGAAHAASAGSTLLVDRPDGLGGLPADGVNSAYSATDNGISDNGRWVIFQSNSDGLLPPGVSGTDTHTFVRDRTANSIQLADVAADGTTVADTYSTYPVISGDGRHVAFVSSASNLVPGAGGGSRRNVFVKNLDTGAIVVASRATGANGAVDDGDPSQPDLTADGSQVAFVSSKPLDAANDAGNKNDVYVRNLTTGSTTLVSASDGGSTAQSGSSPSISPNGAFVAFSTPTAIDASLDNNTRTDIYLRSGSTTTLMSVSLTTGKAGANGDAVAPSLAVLDDNNLRVAFESTQTDLVPGDANGVSDVFVATPAGGANRMLLIDRPDGSTSSTGNAGATGGAISKDGTQVSFVSAATNLTAGAPVGGGSAGVFVRTIGTIATPLSTTRLASRTSGGDPASGYAASLSRNGTVVSFSSRDTSFPGPGPDVSAVYVRSGAEATIVSSTGAPAATNDSTIATSGGSGVNGSAISADGRYVVFTSLADGLSPDDENRTGHVYLRDLQTNALRLLDAGVPGPATRASRDARISADGKVVIFTASDSGFGIFTSDSVVYRRDLASNELAIVSRADGPGGAVDAGFDPRATISGDGNRIAFVTSAKLDPVHDTNANSDVYVRDVKAGTTTLVSRADGAGGNAGDGSAYDPQINADGSRVVFESASTTYGESPAGHLQAFVRDLGAGTTRLVSRADGAGAAVSGNDVIEASISADGNRIAFRTSAANLGDGTTGGKAQIHVRDVAAATTRLVSRVGTDGAAGDNDSSAPAISGDGNRVAFNTQATNLAAGTPTYAVLVHDLTSGVNTIVGRADGASGTPVSAFAGSPDGDGGCVAFTARGAGLTPGGYASADFSHVYVRAVSGECPVAAPTPVATVTPTPTVSSTPTPTPTPTPPAGDRTKPVISKLKVTRTRIRFTLSEKAKVKTTVKRGKKKRVATVTKTLRAGKVTIKLSKAVRKKLRKRGRYTFRLVATDAAGNASRARTAKLRVKRR